jgi:glycosyltransferase involved in cell wall biosynthesis
MPKPLHIVQVGYDDSVFVADAPSDTRLRQKLYAQLLAERRPGSRMTLLILTHQSGYQPAHDGLVTYLPVTGWAVLRPLRLFGQLFALHREQKIDVIAAQTIFTDAWIALAFAAFTQAKVVGQIHMDVFSPLVHAPIGGRGMSGSTPLRVKVGLRLMRRLKVVRVVSQHLRSEILARGLHSNVVVVPVPVTMLATPPSSLQHTEAGTRRVLYVGRLAAEKNLWRWLRVAQRVGQEAPDVEFEWAGDGDLRDELLAEAERRGLKMQLHWLGAIPYNLLSASYGRAAVLLLTSDHESFGRVLVEAGWHGLPVVAPRFAGIEEVVSDGETGLLCPPGDEPALAEAVLRLLRDPALAGRMGAAARTRMKSDFDPQRLAEQWVDVLIRAAETRA